MLYLTFFLLREGHHLVELMVRALPLGNQRERLLFSKFARGDPGDCQRQFSRCNSTGRFRRAYFLVVRFTCTYFMGRGDGFFVVIAGGWGCFGVVTCFFILVRYRRLGDRNYSGGLWRFSYWSG